MHPATTGARRYFGFLLERNTGPERLVPAAWVSNRTAEKKLRAYQSVEHRHRGQFVAAPVVATRAHRAQLKKIMTTGHHHLLAHRRF